jgi:hypothetical protein
MNAAELKNNLIKIIIDSNNMEFLKAAFKFFKTQNASLDWWDELSEDEKKLIEIGVEEIERGGGIPYEKVSEDIKKKLYHQ